MGLNVRLLEELKDFMVLFKEEVYLFFLKGRGWGSFSFGFFIKMFFFTDHKNIDGDVIDLGEFFKILETGFSETIFESAVFWLRDPELVSNVFLFKVM